jgi:mycofactocin glycosyltransferase
MMAFRELPAVSVVVPVYNSERTVEHTIRSLLALNYPKDRLELIFVDNASTDDSPGILAAHAAEIRVLREGKLGRSAARNLGIHEALHPIVAFTDADCVVDPDWLKHLVAPLDAAQVGISGGNIRALRPCNAIQEYGEWLHDHRRAIQTYKPPYATTVNWASRRSVLIEAGCFDERLPRCEDADLAYRIVQADREIVYQDQAVIYHRNRPDLAGLLREGYWHGFYSVAVLKKHRNFVRKYGYRRGSLKSYRVLARSLIRVARGAADPNTLYDTVFNSGKKAGKLAGSLRFGHLQL